MGTDIHPFIEVSDDGGQTWNLYKNPIIVHRSGRQYDINDLHRYCSRDGELNSMITSRDYGLFGIMAGVRGRPPQNLLNGLERAVKKVAGKPVYVVGVAKGLPLNPSHELAKVSSDPDWHSHSWCIVDELKFWLSVHRKNGGRFYGWGEIRDRMVKLEKKGMKTRLVMWFDS